MLGARHSVCVTVLAALLAGAMPMAVVGEEQPSPSVELRASAPSVEEHHAVTVFISVISVVDRWAIDASVTVREDGRADPWCVIPASADTPMSCEMTLGGLGVHQLTAEFSGNAVVTPAVSDPLLIEVVPDTVHVTSVRLLWHTFYPYRDGYRDALPITGTRLEPLTVTVRITNDAGALVALTTLPQVAGRYTWLWQGRTTSGTLLPAGRYTVRQTFRDSFGTTHNVTLGVTLSRKRLVWHTTTVAKAGSNVRDRVTGGAAKVTIDTSAGSARLIVPRPYGTNVALIA